MTPKEIFSTAFHLRDWLELLGVSGICGWAACLALGLSFFSPSKAIVVGLCGVAVGSSLWLLSGLPVGPEVSNVPLIPSLVGTLLVAFVVELASEARLAAQELKMTASRRVLPRSWETVELPQASEAPQSPKDALLHETPAGPRIDG